MAAKPKIKYERKKPHCTIGTIGHVDHGKTTLTAAITKTLAKRNTTKYVAYNDIDRDATERARGITINATHIEYETDFRHYTHIDCPGHQDYIKNMIIGTTQMEGVILVIAYTEGPQEQTREHLILAKEIGVKHMVVFGNKIDALLELDLVEYIDVEILGLLENYGYINVDIIKGSARVALTEDTLSMETSYGGEAIMNLMDRVDAIPQPVRNLNEPFLMPIEDSFSITGRGTVLTGKIERGILKVGDDVDILGPKKYTSVCTGLEMYHKFMDFAEAGENVGVLVRSIARSEVKRGFLLAKPHSIKLSKSFEAKAYILTREEGGRKKGFASNFKPQFFFRTSNITGSITILKAENLSEEGDMSEYERDTNTILALPGDTILFHVSLNETAGLNEGLRFAIREGTLTIGAGIIIKVF